MTYEPPVASERTDTRSCSACYGSASAACNGAASRAITGDSASRAAVARRVGPGLLLLALAASALPVLAQGRIYRCGNEYTNNAEDAKRRGCKVMDGGNITVIQGPRPSSSGGAGGNSAAPRPAAPRTDSTEQRARDSDARTILEAELRRAEERLAQARQAYANGEPPKEGIEGRNHQRYLDRVAELKAAVTRAESDVNSIRNELARNAVPSASANR